jgi:hypothetical protein
VKGEKYEPILSKAKAVQEFVTCFHPLSISGDIGFVPTSQFLQSRIVYG